MSGSLKARAAWLTLAGALALALGVQGCTDAHDEHAHDEHAHEEHAQKEHAQEEHAQEEHAQEEHGEDEHGEDEHGEDEHGEDEHGEEQHDEPRTDAHHVAEDRPRCEDDVELSEDAVRRYEIEVEPALERELVPRISAPGHLAFPDGAVARVGCAVAGRVAALRVRSGDAVARGDELLVIESPALGEMQGEYLRQRALAAAAGPAVDRARAALERARELHDRVQGVPLAEVEARAADLAAAERDRDVARATEAALRGRLALSGLSEERIAALEHGAAIDARLAIPAPIDGRVVEIAVALGQLVGPDDERLIVVGDPRELWAIADVSESRLSEIALGARARVAVPALGATVREGEVAGIAAVLETSTRTAEVRIAVPNPDGAMLPGMFLQVEIDSSKGAGAPVLAVPDGAVLMIEGRPSVFVPVSPGVFCRHAIEVGPAVGGHLPVLAGLAPGEPVVVSGTFRLKAEHGKRSARHEH